VVQCNLCSCVAFFLVSHKPQVVQSHRSILFSVGRDRKSSEWLVNTIENPKDMEQRWPTIISAALNSLGSEERHNFAAARRTGSSYYVMLRVWTLIKDRTLETLD
jgi:hypothetical protein